MTKEQVKEMRNFGITSLVFSVLIFGLITFLSFTGKEVDGMLPIASGVLLAIGITILPKASIAKKKLKEEGRWDG